MFGISANTCFTLFIALNGFVLGFNVPAQSSSQQRVIRQAIVDSAFAEVGNYEKSNQNDGKVDKYQRQFKALGAKKGDAYCSWGILYCMKMNGVKPQNVNGKAISWSVPKKSIIREYGKITKSVFVKRGDICLFYNYDRKRKRGNWHVEIVTGWHPNDDFVNTIGFNTWSNLEGRKRQGVYAHERNKFNVIICNQLDIYFQDEKSKTLRIAHILVGLQRKKLRKT